MKEIKCYVRPSKADAVLDALHSRPDLPGVTASEVRGFGRSHPSPKGEELCTPMVKLEIVVPDEMVETVKAIVLRNANTGRAGDGMVYISAVEAVIRIRGKVAGPE